MTGFPFANPIRRPSLAKTTSRSLHGTFNDSRSFSNCSAPQHRSAGAGNAMRMPKHWTLKSSGSMSCSYRNGTAIPVMSMVAHDLWPTMPVATCALESSSSGSCVIEWNTMSASEGHALSVRCAFGFHPSLNVGANNGSSDAVLSSACTSQYGAKSVTEFSMGIESISLKENKKFEYPPTRNSPGARLTSPNVTLGPTSSKSRTRSEHGTARWPPSDESSAVGISCAPQHMNTNRDGSAVSVAPDCSSVTTTRENSNATVTPLRETDFSAWSGVAESSRDTTREMYISRAAAGPPDVDESTAPTRTRSSEGRLVHVVTLNFSAPDSRSGQFVAVEGSWSKRLGVWA